MFDAVLVLVVVLLLLVVAYLLLLLLLLLLLVRLACFVRLSILAGKRGMHKASLLSDCSLPNVIDVVVVDDDDVVVGWWS